MIDLMIETERICSRAPIKGYRLIYWYESGDKDVIKESRFRAGVLLAATTLSLIDGDAT
jgi:hypothetical protein